MAAAPDASWSFVDVRVPPGALGLIVSKRADGCVVVDGFRPTGANGELGTLQQDGRVVRGSILLGVNEHDFSAAALSFDRIREILITTSALERIVRFSVPPPAPAAHLVSPPAPSPAAALRANAEASAAAAAAISTRRFADEYAMGKELGSGTFSVVREATHRHTGERFAVKCIKRAELSKDDLEALMLEVAILRQMQHPHIVKLFDVFMEEQYYYLVTEFMAGGELFDRIVEKNFYSEREARELVKVLLHTIQFCHDADVVHRDLKPENLLLSSKADGADIKLADFGFAKRVQMDTDGGLATACGTPGYVAPEILQSRPYGKEVDIWSIGVITYILLCGYPPFHDDNQGLLFRKIKAGRFQFDAPYWDNVSTEAKDLISKMLVVNPAERWTAQQLLDHVWIAASNVNTAQLTGALIELRKFNARRKFKAAVSTVKATISLTKKLALLGLSPRAEGATESGGNDKPALAAADVSGTGDGDDLVGLSGLRSGIQDSDATVADATPPPAPIASIE